MVLWRTQKRTKVLLAGFLLAAVIFLGLSIAYGVKLYVAEENLRPGNIQGEGWHSVELQDSKREYLANVNLLFEQSSSGLIPMRLQIAHTESVELDALRFSFDPQPSCVLDAWLKVLDGGPWNPIHTFRIEWTVVFDIEDLGLMGQGSVLLDLFLRPLGSDTTGCSFDFRVYLTLHNPGSVLVETKYVGRFTVPFTIDSIGQVNVSGLVTPY